MQQRVRQTCSHRRQRRCAHVRLGQHAPHARSAVHPGPGSDRRAGCRAPRRGHCARHPPAAYVLLSTLDYLLFDLRLLASAQLTCLRSRGRQQRHRRVCDRRDAARGAEPARRVRPHLRCTHAAGLRWSATHIHTLPDIAPRCGANVVTGIEQDGGAFYLLAAKQFQQADAPQDTPDPVV